MRAFYGCVFALACFFLAIDDFRGGICMSRFEATKILVFYALFNKCFAKHYKFDVLSVVIVVIERQVKNLNLL